MSQICAIEVKVKNLDDLRTALKELGWTLQEGGRVRWYQTQHGEEMDYTIEFSEQEKNRSGMALRDKYNIGLKREGSEYRLIHDNAMNGSEVPGEHQMDDTTTRVINTLKNKLLETSITRQLKAQKRHVERMIMTDGTIMIKGRR